MYICKINPRDAAMPALRASRIPHPASRIAKMFAILKHVRYPFPFISL